MYIGLRASSREDKHLIKLLRQEKHYSARYILKEFPNRNWTLGGLNHLFVEKNLVDYSVWSILQEKVCKTCVTDLDDLKHHIRTEWAKLDHAVIAAAVRQWR